MKRNNQIKDQERRDVFEIRDDEGQVNKDGN